MLLLACQPKKPKEEYATFPQFLKRPQETVTPELFRRAFFLDDEAQKLCSSEALTEDILKRVKELSSNFPKLDGYLGDWRKGEQLALTPELYKRLYGKPGGSKKGLCYACHCADPRVDECGDVGPSLYRYAEKGVKPEELFKRIYNPWAFSPCSAMPRFGHHGLLTAEEVTHLVAYLLSPESPVNGGKP
ncbi:MAG: sulfur oxidation c-type cytochrome SoxX [Aquificae bacterium]|nr:sulfur oxidation c-type cytochrome SoxX [Aquificota bacterium]